MLEVINREYFYFQSMTEDDNQDDDNEKKVHFHYFDFINKIVETAVH